MRVHSDLLPDVVVRHTGLPRPRVTQTIRQLKAAGRISAGRPFAPPLTARDISRLALGLSATSPGVAVAHEREIGRLPLTVGVGEPTLQAAIVALIESSLGGTSTPEGQIAVAQARPFVEVRLPAGTSVYGALSADGFTTLSVIPTAAVCAIARELIDRKN